MYDRRVIEENRIIEGRRAIEDKHMKEESRVIEGIRVKEAQLRYRGKPCYRGQPRYRGPSTGFDQNTRTGGYLQSEAESLVTLKSNFCACFPLTHTSSVPLFPLTCSRERTGCVTLDRFVMLREITR